MDDGRLAEAIVLSGHLLTRKDERFGTSLTGEEIIEALKQAPAPSILPSGRREYQVKLKGRSCTVITAIPDDQLSKRLKRLRIYVDPDVDEVVLTVWDNIRMVHLLR